MKLVGDGLIKQIVDLLRAEPTPCYITGGYVREWLLGQRGRDLDVTVAGPAIPLGRKIADRTGGSFYILDEEMDAARIVYRPTRELVVDVAGLRGPDIWADLRAREFTINAMAVDVREAYRSAPTVFDPCGGRADLRDRVLRATSGSAFEQDGVRLLRAVRFAATLGLRIEPQTASWIRRDVRHIHRSAAERIRQELALIMAARGAAAHLQQLDEFGLVAELLPELNALKGVSQPAPHVYDAWKHTLVTVAEAERLTAVPQTQLRADEREFLSPFVNDLGMHFGARTCEDRTRATLLKFAAMLHDVGKARRVAPNAGEPMPSLAHERSGAAAARAVLTRLRFSSDEVRFVESVVARHMLPPKLRASAPVTGGEIYRFFRDVGDAGVDVVVLALADQLATHGPALEAEHWREHLSLARDLLNGYFRQHAEVVAPPMVVDGTDVMGLLGLKPGPQVGWLLEAVREAQAEGQIRSRLEALEFLRRSQQRTD